MDKDALLQIGRPQRRCMNCDAPIDAFERTPSGLKSSPEKRFERFDYCPTCWEQLKDDAWQSFWLVRREPRRRMPKLNRRQRSAALRALFESLWERRETEDVGPEIYMLAHLLMKWGGLRWRENETDLTGQAHVVFEDPASGDRITIPETKLDDERLVQVQQRVEDFLRQYAPEESEVEL